MVVSAPTPRGYYLIVIGLILAASISWQAFTPSIASTGTPSFSSAAGFTSGTEPNAIAVGDFNGDTKADLAVVNRGSANVSIHLGDGAGGFGVAAPFTVGTNPVAVAVGDFSGDGKADLAVANSGSISDAGSVSILIGDGAGNFGAATNLTVGTHPSFVTLADFSGDSKLDLAVANLDSSNVSVLLGNGGGGFGGPTNFPAGSNPAGVAVGDFNNDSKADLVIANSGSGNVSILNGTGNGSFGSATSFGVGTAPFSVAVGDFNGDAKPDVVTANNASGNVSVLLGDGAGSFASSTSFAAGTNPYAVVLADFYGDGKLDVAVTNSGSANVSVLLGTGAGSLGAATNFTVGTAPRFMATSDFNGDTKPDLAVPNSGSNNVSVLLNTSVVTATISGTVKDTENNPIAGATVEAINSSNQQVVASFVTGADGHYLLTVPLGTYDLKATPPTGSNFRIVTIPNRSIVGDLVQDITLVPPDILLLSGRIVDRDGQGVPNLGVQLETGEFGSGGPSTRTAADGSYQLQTGQGTYFFRVFCRGADVPNVPNAPGFVENGLLRSQSNFISLTQDTVRNVTLPTRIISGRVTDSNGQPVAGVQFTYGTNGSVISNTADLGTVSFSGYSQGPDGSSGTTDSNGLYRIYALPATLPSISVVPPVNSGLAAQNLNNVDVQNDRSIDVVLQPAFTLSGRIVDRDGQGVPNLGVQLETGEFGSGGPSTRTAADGSYQLQTGQGTYFFRVFCRGADVPNVPNAPGFVENGLLRSQSNLISLTQDTVRNVTLPTRIISGRVTDSNGQPVAGVQFTYGTNGSVISNTADLGTVSFSGYSQGPDGSSGTTDSNGLYRIYALPATLPSISVVPPVNSGLAAQNLNNVDVQNDRSIDVVLQPAFTLSGRIVDRDGQGVPNLGVQLETGEFGSGGPSTRTAADGSYQLQTGQGTYFFRVFCRGADVPNVPNAPGFVENGLLRSQSNLISLTQDTVRNVTLPTRIISGRVTDSNGQPVAGVQFTYGTNGSVISNTADLGTVSFSGYSQGPDGSSGTTDSNGLYRIYALPATLPSISVVPPVNSGLAAQNLNNVDVQNDRSIDVVLQRPVHTLSGRITDSMSAPIVGVTVILSGSQSAISTTDGNGNYIFVNVSEAGNYTVTPFRTSYQFTPPNAVFNNLMGDQVANFTGTLFTFSVTGNVRDGGSVAIGGVTVTLSGATTSVTQTDSSGAYAFNGVAAFANYSVKASKSNFTFTPTRIDISNLSSNQTADFTGAPQPGPSPPLTDDFSSAQRDPDKFQFGSLSTDPTAFDPLVTVAQQNGQLEITPRANAFGTHYNGYTTVGAVDVTAANASVEVVQAAGGGAETIFSLGEDRNNRFSFMVQTDGSAPLTSKGKDRNGPLDAAALLIFQITISGQLTALSIPYDPVAHRYWRFRYDPAPNSILFETSPNSALWTARHSVVLQKSVTPMAVELSSGTSSTTPTPGTAVFDNFRLGDKFSISGRVKTGSDVGLSGVTMNLTGTLTLTIATDGTGNFSFTALDAGGTYTVAPSLAGYTFSPENQIFNSLGANQSANFTANATPTPTPTATPTPTPAPPGHTPVGSNVTVQGSGIEVTFSQVNIAGTTTMTSIDPASAGTTPGGYVINGSSVAFEISTTADYTPPVDLCFTMPSVTDVTAFNNLSLLHNEGGVLVDRTVSRDFAIKKICGRVNSLSPFVVASKLSVQYATSTASVTETLNATTKVDLTVTRSGDASAAATVDYATADGTASERSDYMAGLGTVRFAAGETSKTVSIFIVDDRFGETAETFNVTLNNPVGLALGSPAAVTVTINSNESVNGGNPVKDATFDTDFFVRIQYLDFFNREADTGGLNFWKNQIDECPTQSCREVRRINVSAAFFVSIEFQETGYLVYKAYQAAYNTGEFLRLRDFLPDLQEIGRGVVIGQPGWEAQLEANKAKFFLDFVQRSKFLEAGNYPTTLTAAQFVDKLNVNTFDPRNTGSGGVLTQSQRDQLVTQLSVNPTSPTLRAQTLRAVSENALFGTRQFNKAFVLMQYFGYLRRNPNDPPEAALDFGGYNFWLGKLNQFNGNYIEAEMVRAFITSGEYEQRFGP